jgi:hypothetical protein
MSELPCNERLTHLGCWLALALQAFLQSLRQLVAAEAHALAGAASMAAAESALATAQPSDILASTVDAARMCASQRMHAC